MNPTEAPNTSARQRFDQLFGGRVVEVEVADFIKREVVRDNVTVRTLTLAEWPGALASYDDDESMVAITTGNTKAWVATLTPDSFTRVVSACREVNVDFFAHCDRKAKQGMEVLQSLPPAAVDKLAALGKATSLERSQTSQRRPV